MSSRKGSAKARQREAFEQRWDADVSGAGLDDAFSREERRRAALDERRDEVRRAKACSSKNRYATRAEALEVAALCAAHGAPRLQCYRCAYCGGWHLTSHPRNDGAPDAATG